MATVSHEWAPDGNHTGIWQKADVVTTWQWKRGNNSDYCAFSIRPYQANTTLEVRRQWTISGDDLSQTEFFDVLLTGNRGGLLMFNFIKAVGP